MPLTRVVRSKGSTVLVEAHAEVLFRRGGMVHRWTSIFTERIEGFTRDFAPYNKRPRWAHHGGHLKDSFEGTTTPNAAGTEVGFAVGSSSDHSLYVDQGTGIYAGGAPYRAKILPPWRRGEASLYEATWRPDGKRRVSDVWIKGQRGQHFFQKGIERAFQSMLMRSYQLPADPRVNAAEIAAANTLASFLGGHRGGPVFRAQLQEWRQWRDRRWGAGGNLGPGGKTRRRWNLKRRERPALKPRSFKGRGGSRKSEEEIKRNAARRAREYRARQKDKGLKPDRSKKRARARDELAFLTHMRKKYGAQNVDDNAKYKDGYWYVSVRVRGDNGKWQWVQKRGKAKT